MCMFQICFMQMEKKHPVGCNFIRLGDQLPDLHLKIKRGNYGGRPSSGTASDGALAAIIEDSDGTAMFQECSPTAVIASALSRGVRTEAPPLREEAASAEDIRLGFAKLCLCSAPTWGISAPVTGSPVYLCPGVRERQAPKTAPNSKAKREERRRQKRTKEPPGARYPPHKRDPLGPVDPQLSAQGL